jgi:hypothetical protein
LVLACASARDIELDNLLAMQRAANQKGKTDYFPKLLSTHNTEAFNRNFIFHVIELLGNRETGELAVLAEEPSCSVCQNNLLGCSPNLTDAAHRMR